MTVDLFNIEQEEFLDLRFCDLKKKFNLSLNRGWALHFIAPLLKKVKQELRSKGIHIRLSFWVSDEWFCPDGICGVAIPFYLLHPRLFRLEKEMVGKVEGGDADWALRIIRHEIGHAIENLFTLRRNRDRQQMFGRASEAYRNTYDYRPYSKSYVRNLEEGYAQSHPCEDFAETFAVWLDPQSNWKKRYQNWPALKKLEFVDDLMKSLPQLKRDPNVNWESCEEWGTLQTTLRQHYKRKCRTQGVSNSFWKNSIQSLFVNKEQARSAGAYSLIKSYEMVLAKKLSESQGIYRYQALKVIRDLEHEVKKLKLGLRSGKLETRKELSYHLLKKSPTFFEQGRHLTVR